MPNFESVGIISRPGDSTGVGTTVATLGPTSFQVNSPVKMQQDSFFVAERIPITVSFLAAPAAAGFYLYSVLRGLYQVTDVVWAQGTNSTSGTIDVQWCPNATAAGSGTTQLTGTISTATAGNNSTQVLGTLITTPTQAGPGNQLCINLGGNQTGLVGVLTINIARVA